MGTWSATIFGNDISLDIKEDFYERYNNGEEVGDIKTALLLDIDDEDKFNVMFSLAHCLWETGYLDNEFLQKVKKIIESEEDLQLAKELGADDTFIKQRKVNLEKFLLKISIPKEQPKKRVAPSVPVESKYKNGTVMTFQYNDGTWGALIAVESKFYDKETYYYYLQTDLKNNKKPSLDDVLKSHIIDPSFHNKEYNLDRDEKFYYTFEFCIGGYLNKTATKKFEIFNDSFFEIIGAVSDWGQCTSGIFDNFGYYKQKTSDEFKLEVKEELTRRFDENTNIITKMTVEEIDKEFGNKKA